MRRNPVSPIRDDPIHRPATEAVLRPLPVGGAGFENRRSEVGVVGRIGKSSRLEAKTGMPEMKPAIEAFLGWSEMAAVIQLQSRLSGMNLHPEPAAGGRNRSRP